METLWLQRPSGDLPWGFRLQGGREFAEPLSVQRVTPGTVAANCLQPGDVILKIGNVNATNITHNEAQEVITGASNILQLTIKKASVASAPISPVSSVPQYSNPPPAPLQTQYSSQYDQQDKYPPFPDYRVGNAYQGLNNNVNTSDGYSYGSSPNDPYNMRQFEQTPPISGYSTLPARSANRQNSESFRPVQQQGQNKYPYKSTSGIQLQINPQNVPRDEFQNSYNDRGSNYSQSQPMSPVQYSNGDLPYQRQTSVGSNRADTNTNYPQSHFKKPTPFSPSYNNQNGSGTPPPVQRQTSQGTVHESTISPGFKPGTYLPRSEDAPPPPPPPTNYQPEQYRRPLYDQDPGRSSYQRQPSQPNSYGTSPYDQRQNEYNQYQNRQNQDMYVDTGNHPSQQYERQGSRPFEHDSTPPHYQRQPSNPQYYGDKSEQGMQRQTSYGSQPQQPQQYGAPFSPPQSYGRQQSREQQPPQITRQSSRDMQQQPQFVRQTSREQQPQYGRQQHNDPPYQMSPPGNTINSFDDILSPFEHFQNSNYCDKLFARDNRDGDSGVDLNSDTPRSNQSSNMSYSPPQPYSSGYNDRGDVQHQPQTLLRPAPQAPPPPPVTPPPPPPPPPPSDWAPTPKRKIPAPQDGGEQQMPDKVLNTMLKNQGTQKPFAYLPSGTDLKEFKERARQRRQPRPVMPRGYVGPPVDADETAEPQGPQLSKTKPGAMPNPDSGVYKHAQYNSPLRMYSSDSAKEQFNIQTGGKVDVTGVNSTPERRPSDIKDSEVYKMCQAADAQGKDSQVSDLNESEADASRDFYNESRVKDGVPLDDQGDSRERVFSPPPGPTRGQGLSFRVLQWLTDTAEDEQNDNEESHKPRKPRDPLLRHNSADDEMRFTGLHTKADIPSKAFHLLNKIAGADTENAQSSEPSQQDDGNEEPQRIGNYDEASIRYRGNHIPSPSFRLLQTIAKQDELRNKTGSPSGRTATDSEDDGLPDKLNEEDMIDKRYKGGNIPSKSFKALRMYMDDDKTAQGSEEGDGPKIKVISRARSPKVAPKPDRSVNSPVPQVPLSQDAPSTDF